MATKNWQDEVRDSVHKIWLAGLGALAVAEESGSKLFGDLVQEGERFEARGKQQVDQAVQGAQGAVNEAASQARRVAEGTRKAAESLLGRTGDSLDETVARALAKVGVPTRDEINALSRRVEELTRAVERLREQQSKPPAKAPGSAAGVGAPGGLPDIATPDDVVTTTADVTTGPRG